MGTLPVPVLTPRPSPTGTPAQRSPQQIRDEVENYLSKIQVVLGDAIYWYQRLESLGNPARDPEKQRALIDEHTPRIARLHGAALLIQPPEEALKAHEGVLKAFLERQLWLSAASSYLNQGITLDGIASGQDLVSAQDGLVELAGTFGMEYPVPFPSQRILVSQRHRLVVTYPGDWILGDDDFQVVLIAPPSLQKPDLSGLGPSAQEYGTAFKVWALKNPSGWSLGEADSQSQGFLIPFGRVLSREEVTVNQLPAVQRILMDDVTGWKTLFVVTVKETYTYLIEGGCPEGLFDRCLSTFQGILGQIRLTGNP